MSVVELDAYVLDALMPDLVGHDRRPSAFLVYLFLWRRAEGARGRAAEVSLRAIAEGTGLSKRAVQDAVRALVRRRLVAVTRRAAGAVPEYAVQRPWARRTR